MIVMKFGGTSTQDAAAMYNVARVIKARRAMNPVIVISAIAQGTNALENAGRMASEGRIGDAAEIIRKLIDRHVAIIHERIQSQERRAVLLKSVESASCELEQLVQGVSILRELTPQTKDAFYAFGELLSSRIVAAVLQEEGVDAQWIDTREFMVTDDNFTSAMPMMELVKERLSAIASPLVTKGIVPVTQGFIGVTAAGRRTTMGRESSDYSAAVIGAALDVDDIEIWTDVDGVLTADPRVVDAPLKVKVLTFDEAYELSFFGAKVLHPNTMLPAIDKNIPIHVYNSRHPGRSGTLVTANPDTEALPSVKSVAYRRNIVVLSLKPFKRLNQYVVWDHLYNILTKYGTFVSLTASSEFSIVLAIDGKHNCEGVIHEMSALGTIAAAYDKAILCLVGSRIQDSPQLLAKLFAAIEHMKTSMISFGASPTSVSLVIDDRDVLEAVRKIHDAFFTENRSDGIFERLETVIAQ